MFNRSALALVDRLPRHFFADIISDFDTLERNAITTTQWRTHEKDGSLKLSIDLPGIKASEIELSVLGHKLSLKAESARSASGEGKDISIARSYQQSFLLPEGVSAEAVTASLEHGVLEISLPKKAEEVAKKIDIAVRS